MNEIYTMQKTVAVESARWIPSARTESVGPLAPHQAHQGAISRAADIAQKVLRLTGSVRLARRSGQHWHHCGLNE